MTTTFAAIAVVLMVLMVLIFTTIFFAISRRSFRARFELALADRDKQVAKAARLAGEDDGRYRRFVQSDEGLCELYSEWVGREAEAPAPHVKRHQAFLVFGISKNTGHIETVEIRSSPASSGGPGRFYFSPDGHFADGKSYASARANMCTGLEIVAAAWAKRGSPLFEAMMSLRQTGEPTNVTGADA